MTCIVGVFDQHNDCCWIGGDSLGSNGYSKSVQSQPKVFRYNIFKNELKMKNQRIKVRILFYVLAINCLRYNVIIRYFSLLGDFVL